MAADQFAELLRRVREPLLRRPGGYEPLKLLPAPPAPPAPLAPPAPMAPPAPTVPPAPTPTAPPAASPTVPPAPTPAAPCGCARCEAAAPAACDVYAACDICELCEGCAAAEGWQPRAAGARLGRAPVARPPRAATARGLVWVDLRGQGAHPAAHALLAAVVNEAAHVRGLLLDGWPLADADLQLGAPARLEVLSVAGCAALTPRALAEFSALRALDIRGCFAAAVAAALAAGASADADAASAASAAAVAAATAAAPLQVVSVALADSFRALCGLAPPRAPRLGAAARARSPGPLERATRQADQRLAKLGIISSSYLGSFMLAALAPRLPCLVE